MKTSSRLPLQTLSVPLNTCANHVYLLPTMDHARLKIGRSTNPLDRIAGLILIYPEIDLTRAVILEVDTPRLENILHTVFEQHRQMLDERQDGYTEWFQGDFVEEAVAFSQSIAAQRGTAYTVHRQVDTLLQDYRSRNPQAGHLLPRPTKGERQAQVQQAALRLGEAMLTHTQRLIDFLDARPFDALVHCGHRTYLTRTVERRLEPECWLPDGRTQVSEWGQLLAAMARCEFAFDGASATLRLLDLPCFVPLDENQGCEYYRVPEPDPESAPPTVATPSDAAFAELWRVLNHLPLVDVPEDPLSLSGNRIPEPQ